MASRHRALPPIDPDRSLGRSVGIAVALMAVVVLAPAGVRAAGTLVTLVDPQTSSKAHVTDGKLEIGDGTGALTVNGGVRVTNTVGAPIPVTVGNDTFTIKPPGSPWTDFVSAAPNQPGTLFDSNQSPLDLSISSLTAVNGGDVAGVVTFTYSPTCSAAGGGNTTLTELTVGPGQTAHLEYPQPLVRHLGTDDCVLVQVSGNGSFNVTGVGLTE